MNVFDSLVLPWAKQALGMDLSVLKYDANLSNMHIVPLPEVHGKKMEEDGSHSRCSSVQHVGTPPAAAEALDQIKKDLAEIKANMIKPSEFNAKVAQYGERRPQEDRRQWPAELLKLRPSHGK